MRRNYLVKTEFDQMIAVLNAYDRMDAQTKAILHLMYYTGGSLNDLSQLQNKHLDLVNQKVYYRAKPRTIYYPKTIIKHIIDYKSPYDYNPEGLYFSNPYTSARRIVKRLRMSWRKQFSFTYIINGFAVRMMRFKFDIRIMSYLTGRSYSSLNKIYELIPLEENKVIEYCTRKLKGVTYQ